MAGASEKCGGKRMELDCFPISETLRYNYCGFKSICAAFHKESEFLNNLIRVIQPFLYGTAFIASPRGATLKGEASYGRVR